MIYVFLGPPASGKGTQAKLLAEAKQLPFVSISNYLKEASSHHPEIAEAMAKGEIVTLHHIQTIFSDLKHAYPDNVIIDGSFRSTEQVDAFLQFWSVEAFMVFWIDIPDSVIRSRTVRRLDNDGKKRQDDDASIVERRITIYRQTIDPIIAHLKHHQVRIITIDGQPAIDLIHNSIMRAVDNL